MSRFIAAEKLEAVQREIAFRRRVYARFVVEGKMSKGHAAKQIAIFEEIEIDYQAMVQKERLL